MGRGPGGSEEENYTWYRKGGAWWVCSQPSEKTTIVSYVSGQKEKLAINFFHAHELVFNLLKL
jgi:hypothetical protein